MKLESSCFQGQGCTSLLSIFFFNFYQSCYAWIEKKISTWANPFSTFKTNFNILCLFSSWPWACIYLSESLHRLGLTSNRSVESQQMMSFFLYTHHHIALSEWWKCECESGMMAQHELETRVVSPPVCPQWKKGTVLLIQQGNSYCAADLWKCLCLVVREVSGIEIFRFG